ncbi:MAG: EamA family transporter [Proteobacteria bacterium]|nr:EamA family transporter [Pseudomonadota bacterium]
MRLGFHYDGGFGPSAAGGAAIILGIVFLTGGFRGNLGQLPISIAFGLGVGVPIGSYTVLDAHAVSVVLIPPLLLDYGSSLGRVICLSPFAVRRWGQIREAWRRQRLAILGIAVFKPLAYILVLIALKTTPIVFVAPVRELSVLFTVALGVLFLGEGVFRSRMAWAVLIVAGVIVLATA